MNLFLDDIRSPQFTTHVKLPDVGTWTIVRNYDEFVKTISDHFILYNELPDFISFDHDLADVHYAAGDNANGDLEKTGYDCAKWLVKFCMNKNIDLTSDWMCHSMNPVGKRNIECYLHSFQHQS
jgi:hypothetical protein